MTIAKLGQSTTFAPGVANGPTTPTRTSSSHSNTAAGAADSPVTQRTSAVGHRPRQPSLGAVSQRPLSQQTAVAQAVQQLTRSARSLTQPGAFATMDGVKQGRDQVKVVLDNLQAASAQLMSLNSDVSVPKQDKTAAQTDLKAALDSLKPQLSRAHAGAMKTYESDNQAWGRHYAGLIANLNGGKPVAAVEGNAIPLTPIYLAQNPNVLSQVAARQRAAPPDVQARDALIYW